MTVHRTKVELYDVYCDVCHQAKGRVTDAKSRKFALKHSARCKRSPAQQNGRGE